MADPQFFYRLEDVVYASPLDEYGYSTGRGRLEVVTRKYLVDKTTPCGVWLDIGRFVRLGTRKQFAHPTLAEARESFAARKRRQAEIYEARARRAREALSMANGGLFAHSTARLQSTQEDSDGYVASLWSEGDGDGLFASAPDFWRAERNQQKGTGA